MSGSGASKQDGEEAPMVCWPRIKNENDDVVGEAREEVGDDRKNRKGRPRKTWEEAVISDLSFRIFIRGRPQ